jgi:hypothetical protein
MLALGLVWRYALVEAVVALLFCCLWLLGYCSEAFHADRGIDVRAKD